jgi:hypothetical protein
MPEPISAGLIAAGASLASQGINAGAQASMNRKTRQWNERQYQIQRDQALADWMRQNEYNHPAAQMQRLKEAGLNPNLVYGKGADAMSGQSVRSTDVKSWSPQAPQVDLSGATQGLLFAGVNLKAKQAQVDNLEQVVKNNKAKEQETAARTLNILGNTEKTSLQNKRYNELVDSQLSLMGERTRQTQAATDQTLTRTEQLKMIFTPTMQKAVEEVLNMRLKNAKTREETNLIKKQIETIGQDIDLKQLDKDLKKLGIQPGDNMFMRMGARIINGILGDIKNPKDQTWHKSNKPNKVMDR